jgi:hypothetical protein
LVKTLGSAGSTKYPIKLKVIPIAAPFITFFPIFKIAIVWSLRIESSTVSCLVGKCYSSL